MPPDSTSNLTQEELLALLRDARLRVESIATEIEIAGEDPVPPAQLEEARALLQELPQGGPELVGKAASLPDLLGAALVRAAGELGRAELLRDFALSTSKAMAKEAKRELQRFKQRGISVPELPAAPAPLSTPKPSAEEGPACHATSIDPFGERVVWFARPARGGVDVVQAVISDVRGILAIEAMSISKRSYRELQKRLPRSLDVATVEVPTAAARQLIVGAAEEGLRNGYGTPPGYPAALAVLGPPPSAPPPPLCTSLPIPQGAADELCARAEELFADALFARWIPEEEALRSFAVKADSIAQSQLYVDEAQRRDAFRSAAREAGLAYFEQPARRGRHAARLREMSFVLEGADKPELARICLAVSRALSERVASAEVFGTALFARALEARVLAGQPVQMASRGARG